jgi:hypothetical protein
MATAIHAFSPEEMMAYLDGELAPERALQAAEHLDECRECQNLVADLQGLTKKLATWEVAVSDSLPPEIQPASLPKTATPFWRRPAAAMYAAALVVTLMGITWRFHDTRQAIVMRDMPVPLMELRDAPSAGLAPAALAPINGRSSSEQQRPAFPRAETSPTTEPLIARTAQLLLIGKDVDQTLAEVERVTAAHQGYISQLQLSMQSGSRRSLSASLRVPAAQLDAVLRECKQLGRVSSESQFGEDVTQRSVDLDARLSNLKVTEARLQQILRERTGKLSDVLEVEQAVDRTRGEIETAEAEHKSLANQIAYAALQLTVSEIYKTSLESGDEPVLTRLRNSAVEGYQNAFDMVIGALTFLLSIGPALLVVVAIGFLPCLWVWRRRNLSLARS